MTTTSPQGVKRGSGAVRPPAVHNVNPSHATDHLAIGNHATGNLLRELRSDPTGEHDSGTVQRKPSAAPGSVAAPAPVAGRSGKEGTPLDSATRSFLEPRFGRNFSQVRVHTGRDAAASARSLNALAYTVGRDVVFGDTQYSPRTTTGMRLIAHELTHVLQQERTGFPVVQRREGKYPDPPEPLKYKKDTFPIPYTVLKPKKLDAKGPFSSAILQYLSLSFTDIASPCVPTGTGKGAQLCGPSRSEAGRARLILTLLESSSEFVTVAAELDKFYGNDKNPGFAVRSGSNGTKFVPAGTAYRSSPSGEASAEDVDVIVIDESVNPRMQNADPSMSAKPDEQIAVAFVQAIVHESSHAFRRATNVNKGGVKGAIEDEFKTRLKEEAILKQVRDASSSKGIKEQAEGYIKDIGGGSLTQKSVALSRVSGEGITYFESFFVDVATTSLLKEYKKGTVDDIPGLAKLPDPTSDALGTEGDRENSLLMIIDELSSERERLIDSDVGLSGKESPLRIKTLPSRIKPSEALQLVSVLSKSMNLKEIVKEAPNVKGLSAEAKTLFFYILLFKVALIRDHLKEEHDTTNLTPGSKAYEKFAAGLAKKFLGESRSYDLF